MHKNNLFAIPQFDTPAEVKLISNLRFKIADCFMNIFLLRPKRQQEISNQKLFFGREFS